MKTTRAVLVLFLAAACAPLQAPPPEAAPSALLSRETAELLEKNLTEPVPLRAAPRAKPPADWDALVELPFKVSGPRAYRPHAKTTLAMKGAKLAPFEPFDDVPALIDELNAPGSEKATVQQYGITNATERTPPELRNVIVRGYLRALKLEARGDQDFHVMVCKGAGTSPKPCFTVEVSGLPFEATDKMDEFRRVRRELVRILGGLTDDVTGKPLTPGGIKDKFRVIDSPPLVEVKGSLFLDAHHAAGDVGPKGFESATSWEVHPVYSIRVID